MNETRVILASASPRRAALLDQIGVAYRVYPVNIDETRRDAESPADYVRRVALDKARAGWQQTDEDEGYVVLAADRPAQNNVRTADSGIGFDKRSVLRSPSRISMPSFSPMVAMALRSYFRCRVFPPSSTSTVRPAISQYSL